VFLYRKVIRFSVLVSVNIMHFLCQEKLKEFIIFLDDCVLEIIVFNYKETVKVSASDAQSWA